MHIMHRLAPGLVAGSLLVGSASGVFAAKQHTVKVGYAAGQVSNLTSAGFTLTMTPKKVATGATAAAPKVVQVTIAATTKQQARKGTTGSLTAGEYALVVGTKTATGLTARRVLFSATAFKAGRLIRVLRARHILARATTHRVVGLVNLSSTTASTLSLTTKKGAVVTFTITPTTRYRVAGAPVTVAPTFTNAERVVVVFKRDPATKTRTALGVVVPKSSTT
jgi:hypothetical protein